MCRSGLRTSAILTLMMILAGPVGGLRAQEESSRAPAATPAPAAASAPSSTAASPKAAQPSPTKVGKAGIFDLVRTANPMLWPLLICSIIAMGYTLERLVALRRSRVIPREFVERFLDRLESGKLDRDRAIELCRSSESSVARIFARIVRYWGQPAGMIREAVAAESASEMLEMRRNVRVLNGTATIAPLLGLLGTVIGLIEAFDALGGHMAGGVGKSEALAHGISLALMATAFGLAIAVLSVLFYYFLLNRVDLLIRALDEQATKVIDLVASEPGSRPLADARRPMVNVNDMTRQDARTY